MRISNALPKSRSILRAISRGTHFEVMLDENGDFDVATLNLLNKHLYILQTIHRYAVVVGAVTGRYLVGGTGLNFLTQLLPAALLLKKRDEQGFGEIREVGTDAYWPDQVTILGITENIGADSPPEQVKRGIGFLILF
jgi:hypothetical protein